MATFPFALSFITRLWRTPFGMVLDNWGDVKSWTALAPVTSRGPSGIGFVNFGAIGRLDVRASITTTGPGARGFNLYDGSLQHASFDSITTKGDGAFGGGSCELRDRLAVGGSDVDSPEAGDIAPDMDSAGAASPSRHTTNDAELVPACRSASHCPS
jgi:hypothetical protein